MSTGRQHGNSTSPSGITLLHTWEEHDKEINRIAWSSDGYYLASSSFDGTVNLWDYQAMESSYSFLGIGSSRPFYSVAWSPDGNKLAACSSGRYVLLWDRTQNWQGDDIERLHTGNIYDIGWSSDGTMLASCSEDHTISLLQSPLSQRNRKRRINLSGEIFCLTWAPHSPTLFAIGSFGGTIRLWDTTSSMEHPTAILRAHKDSVCQLAWSRTGHLLASCSEDCTIRLWDTEKGKLLRVLEGHTNAVTSVSFSFDNSLLASKSRDNTVRLWRTDNWQNIATLHEIASNGMFAGLAFHPHEPVLATVGDQDKVVHLWHLDIPHLLELAPAQPMVHYTNAKVVLVGESGVGKTALGQVLTGQSYDKTDSTHGRFVYNFADQTVHIGDGWQEQRETFLWDLAGQTGSRLIHQLHLAEVAVALIVFSDNQVDPLGAVSHWVRALRMAQNVQNNAALSVKKLLVEARVDRGRVKVSQEEMQVFLQRMGLDQYIATSAARGDNIAELKEMIQRAIDWDTLPKVTSTELFQRIKAFLVAQKETGSILSSSDTLYRNFLHAEEMPETTTEVRKEFTTCISLIESQGLIRRLSFGGLILLQPELLDAYATALVNTARKDPDSLGSVAETKIQLGDFEIPKEVRVSEDQEKLLLLAMIEDLLNYEVALREYVDGGPYLVFPSEVTRPLAALSEPQGKTIVFSFDGPVLNIYATLAVRLSHSGFFTKQEMWQNAVTYSTRVGGTCGIALSDLRTMEEGHGELTLLFDRATSEETRFQFEDYVRTHLERYTLPGSLHRRRIFRCPAPDCQEELTESQVTQRRKRNTDWARCPACDTRIFLQDGLERLKHGPDSLVQQIDYAANVRVERDTAQVVVQGKIETHDFDVFLCHNEEDKLAVKEIGSELKELRLLPWLDEWNLQPGLPWQRVLEGQIEHIKSAAVFVGKNGIGPWQRNELDAFLRQFADRNCPVIPVILADAPQQPQLPIFLQGMTWVDFREQDPDPMERLIWGITGRKVTP